MNLLTHGLRRSVLLPRLRGAEFSAETLFCGEIDRALIAHGSALKQHGLGLFICGVLAEGRQRSQNEKKTDNQKDNHRNGGFYAKEWAM